MLISYWLYETIFLSAPNTQKHDMNNEAVEGNVWAMTTDCVPSQQILM